MKTVLFGDIHLDAATTGQERMKTFAAYLRTIDPETTGRVIVLGDLFDFWFEYRHVIFSGYFDVLRAFADLRDRGVDIHFFCGNHDFWAGRFLTDDMGFHVHKNHSFLGFGGKQALLYHGDGVPPGEWSYRAYKRFARARPVVALFRLLHPDWAMAVARCVSQVSRFFSRGRNHEYEPGKDRLRAHAHKVLAEGDVDIVICGHSHHAEVEQCPGKDGKAGLYVNPGTWLDAPTFIEWEDGEFTLRSFEAAEPVARRETGRAEQ